jgi:undecaprenyl-diphosphatase
MFGQMRRRIAGAYPAGGRVPFVGTRVLVVLLLVAGFGWAFVELTDEVREGETRAFDTAILLALRVPGDPADPLGPRWFEELARDVTALGGVGVLTLLTLAVAGLLWLQGRDRSMVLVLVSVAGGLLLSTLFKEAFARPRPDLVPHGATVYTASFPSGHSMMAAVTYLTLAVMYARVEPLRAVKIYLIAVACLIILLVGASRVYLGVHWPTDVLAGWLAGATWALLCWLIARWLQRRGAVEPEAGDCDVDGDR